MMTVMKCNNRLFREKVKIESMSIDSQSSQEILEDLINQMNEYPTFFELNKLVLEGGVITQDISDELLNEWFGLPKEFSSFNLNCVVDFSKTYPRVILYESYLHENLDSGVALNELNIQNDLFLIQDQNGISRLAGCVSKVNDFNECKSSILLLSRNVLLAFSRRLNERRYECMH